MKHWLAITITILIAANSRSAAQEPSLPPKPDFKNPVDYRAWYAKRVMCEGEKNAFETLFPSGLKENSSKYQLTAGLPPEDQAFIDNTMNGGPIWNPNDHPLVLRRIDEWRPLMINLRKSADLRCMWQPEVKDTKLLWNLPVNGISAGRLACKVALLDAWMKRSTQATAIVDACEVILKHADHNDQRRNLLGSLVASANRELALRNLLAVWGQSLLSRTDTDRAIDILNRHPAKPETFIDGVISELAMNFELVQYLFPNGEFSKERSDELKQQDELGIMQLPDKGDSPNKLVDQLFQCHNDLVRAADGPISSHTDKRIARCISDWTAKLGDSHWIRKGYETYRGCYGIQITVEARRRGTIIALLVHKYKLNNGKWPASLAELNLAKDSQTLIDPLSGNRFAYRVEKAEPLLYSFATDGQDDGAKHVSNWGRNGENGDFVFLPYQKPDRIPIDAYKSDE